MAFLTADPIELPPLLATRALSRARRHRGLSGQVRDHHEDARCYGWITRPTAPWPRRSARASWRRPERAGAWPWRFATGSDPLPSATSAVAVAAAPRIATTPSPRAAS